MHKGKIRATHSNDGKLSLWLHMDIVCRNKDTGDMEQHGEYPKAFNMSNNEIYGNDFWDLICVPKHGKYLIKT
eukprot:15338390-Ditylum_brightwellii.AAC.1